MPQKTTPHTNLAGYPFIPPKLVESNWKWYVEYWVYSFEKDGLVRKRIFKIPGESEAEKRSEANKICLEIYHLLSNGYMEGKESQPKPSKKLFIKDAFIKAAKIKSNQVGDRYVEKLRSCSNVFFQWLEEEELTKKPIEKFSKEDIYKFQSWLKEVRNARSPYTWNAYRSYLSACLGILKKIELIESNPILNIPELPTHSRRHVPFTEDQQKILEKFLQKDNPQLFIFTQFIYYTFMRPVELTRLKFHHIDLKNRIILVRSHMSKSKKQAPVVIPGNLVPIIEDIFSGNHPDYYFVFGKNKLQPGPEPILRNRVSEMHSRALKDTGLYNKELTLYSWKHTGNCNAYRAGVDIRSIQAQNRHHSLEMTELYLRSMGLRISSDLKNLNW